MYNSERTMGQRKNQRRMRILTVLSALSLSLLAPGCDESLPPRDEPQRYLAATYSTAAGVVEVRDSLAVGLGGAFVISVTNVYSEVLEDAENARADIDVWFRDVPERVGTFTAVKRNLTDQQLVRDGKLTLRPHVTAVFLKQWEHKTSQGRFFWEFVGLHFVEVPNSNGYWESDSVRLVARGRVQLFKTRAPDPLPPIQFTLVYRLWVPSVFRLHPEPLLLNLK